MRNSFYSQRRNAQYRLGQWLIVLGALAVGSLMLDKLLLVFQDSFREFYGLSIAQYQHSQLLAPGESALTFAHLSIAIITLIGIPGFIIAEHRRVREVEARCSGGTSIIVESRLTTQPWFEIFIQRTSIAAAVLFTLWLAQAGFSMYLAGTPLLSESLAFAALLPLASVFGVSVISAMVVAVISMIGMRAFIELEAALRSLRQRWRIVRSTTARRFEHVGDFRTIREIIGYDILSRPPPLAAR